MPLSTIRDRRFIVGALSEFKGWTRRSPVTVETRPAGARRAAGAADECGRFLNRLSRAARTLSGRTRTPDGGFPAPRVDLRSGLKKCVVPPRGGARRAR